MSKQKKGRTPMTDEAARRIQSAEATRKGGQTSADDFAARAARAARRNDRKRAPGGHG